MRDLWIAGFPSCYGGADTELDHNIDLWRKHGAEVHLVPMFGYDEKMRGLCLARGCHVHTYHPCIFKDRIVASWCNGDFLSRLPEIMQHGRPALTIWFNCMTWHFDRELEAHKNGWIDLFGFVSAYQRGMLTPKLEKIGPVAALEGYRPYFNRDNKSQRLEFSYREPQEKFVMGRVSRDDGNKFSADMWRIFDKVCSPRPTKTLILGYGDNARVKTGPPPAGLDHQTWPAGGLPVKEFYEQLHVLIHKTGGSRESFGRVVLEAYASGVPVIVENNYAFPDLVVQGVTGFLCRNSDEMSFAASILAFDEAKRKRMLEAGHEFLLNELADDERCWKPWKKILD